MNIKRLSLLLMIASTVSACASYESLYADYDAYCEQQVTNVNQGVFIINTESVIEGMLWQPSVFFGFDRSNLEQAEIERIRQNIKVLEENPGTFVSVRAFTDQVGSWEYNKRLAERRLQAVKAVFAEYGVSEARIIGDAAGNIIPLGGSTRRDDRIVNRRVEMILLDENRRPIPLMLDSEHKEEYLPPVPIR